MECADFFQSVVAVLFPVFPDGGAASVVVFLIVAVAFQPVAVAVESVIPAVFEAVPVWSCPVWFAVLVEFPFVQLPGVVGQAVEWLPDCFVPSACFASVLAIPAVFPSFLFACAHFDSVAEPASFQGSVVEPEESVCFFQLAAM